LFLDEDGLRAKLFVIVNAQAKARAYGIRGNPPERIYEIGSEYGAAIRRLQRKDTRFEFRWCAFAPRAHPGYRVEMNTRAGLG
jgi:hypothetical protein